ncbi:MAG: hypothetical protein KKF44_09165 [Nanoarchaeota archaeon]|nr:hypothetical protein [Nanoarchaeota archaeon]
MNKKAMESVEVWMWIIAGLIIGSLIFVAGFSLLTRWIHNSEANKALESFSSLKSSILAVGSSYGESDEEITLLVFPGLVENITIENKGKTRTEPKDLLCIKMKSNPKSCEEIEDSNYFMHPLQLYSQKSLFYLSEKARGKTPSSQITFKIFKKGQYVTCVLWSESGQRLNAALQTLKPQDELCNIPCDCEMQLDCDITGHCCPEGTYFIENESQCVDSLTNGICDPLLGENCFNNIDCRNECDLNGDICCPESTEEYTNGCLAPTDFIDYTSCNCNNECQSLNCAESIFDRDDKACCPIDFGWNGTDCFRILDFCPDDTPCASPWPSNQGPIVKINHEFYSCDNFEVCRNDLNYIAEEAEDCCKNACIGHCHGGCQQIYNEWSGLTTGHTDDKLKKCHALYIIQGLGPFGHETGWMENYFSPEICCGMNTATFNCAGYICNNPDQPISMFNSNAQNLPCHAPPPLNWIDDADMSKNNCYFADLPVHASINIISTGTCVDYSIATTSLLRKMGYKNNEIYSVSGPDHQFNLVLFPGDPKWHLVDTTGNNPSAYRPGNNPANWYNYCSYELDSCLNDNGENSCPAKTNVYSC